MVINFNLGRSFFFACGTREIKIIGNKADLRGMFTAEIRNLITGERSLRPVKLVGNRWIGETMAIEIH